MSRKQYCYLCLVIISSHDLAPNGDRASADIVLIMDGIIYIRDQYVKGKYTLANHCDYGGCNSSARKKLPGHLLIVI